MSSLRPRTLLRAVFALMLSGLLVLTAACSQQSAGGSTSTDADKPYTIGVLIKDTTIPFFGRQIDGYKQTAEKLGMKVEIFDGRGDNAQQVAAIQQMVAKKVNMIMVTPGDSQAINGALKSANQANIPVMAVNTAPSASDSLISFVGADNIEYGKALVQLTVKAIGETGSIAIVRGTLGDPPDTERRQGIEDELKKHPGIKIVAEQTGNWDSAKALAVTQDFMSKYGKGQLNAILDVGPEAAGGAKYAHDNGRDDIKFIIGDFPQNVKQGVQDGYIYGAVNQDPYQQSQKAMELAKKYLDGDKAAVEKTVYLPLPLVTKENVADYPAAW